MDAAHAAGAPLFFPPGTYKCGLVSKTYAPNIWAFPGTVTILVTNTSSWTWSFVGAAGTPVSLTGDAAADQRTVAANSSTFSVGQLVQVGDSQAPYSFQPTRYQGQMSEVQAVPDGASLTLTDSLYTTFLTSSSATVTPITNSPTGCRISGIRFYNTTSTSLGGFLRFRYCRDIDLDFQGEGSGHAGARLEHCYNFRVRTFAKNYLDVTQTGLQQFGYGVECCGATGNGTAHVVAQRVRHAFTAGGIDGEHGEALNIQVTGVAHGCTAGSWDAHAHAHHISFNDCHSIGAFSYGFQLRGTHQHILGGFSQGDYGGVYVFEAPGYNRIEHLKIRNVRNTDGLDTSGGVGGQGIFADAALTGLAIRDCELENIARDGIELKNGVQTDCEIENNTIRNVGLSLVSGQKNALRNYTGFTNTRIRNNTVEDNQGGSKTTLNAFVFDSACTDTTMDANRVHNAIIETSGSGASSVVVRPLPQDRTGFWLPTGAIDQTIPHGRTAALANTAALTSGTLLLAGGIVLPASKKVTSVTFVSGATALATGTNQWFCLVDQSLNILRQTSNDTSTAWAANSTKTLNLATTYTPTTDIACYVGILVTASTVPTLQCVTVAAAAAGITPMTAATANTGLTNVASLSSVGALTAVSSLAYAYVS